MSRSIPVPRLVPSAVDVLEERARALARGASDEADASAGLLRLVVFALRGRPCALETASVERVVLRLARPLGVPLAGGGERLVSFVEERPVPLADLAGFVAGVPREASALAGAPALVLSTPSGPVAVAVDGPLELAERRLAAAATPDPGHGDERVRVAGVLDGGAALVDAAWLVAWAGRVARG
jgi:hypothetical protein